MARAQEPKAQEKKPAGRKNRRESRATSGLQEALGQQKDRPQKGESARSTGREPKPTVRSYYFGLREREKAKLLKAKQSRKLEEQLYWNRERERKELSEEKKAEELKKREEELLWIRRQADIAACM